MTKNKEPNRSYRQSVRAEGAQETGEAILKAARELTTEKWLDELTLDDIAERAGVAVRTVFRRFGTRDDLITAMVDKYRAELESGERKPPLPGEVAKAIAMLVESYERQGAYNLRGLAQESRWPFIRDMFDHARARHRRFVEQVFALDLEGLPNEIKQQRTAQLEVATWMTTWKYFRIDLALSKTKTEAALLDLVKAITTRV